MFDRAVAVSQPAHCVPANLPVRPKGRTVVVGFGKAAAAMARAVEEHWPGRLSGLVVTRYGHAVPCRAIEVVEAAHPVPDAAGRAAAARIVETVGALSADDLVVCLISGGGSALLALPAPGLTLEDKQAVNAALLKSGATISEMNCVRKHLSAVKGGRLAAAAFPARVVTLAISDVPGDDPAVIASGPTVADPTTVADARAVLEKYAIEPPEAVSRQLSGAGEETLKPGDERLQRPETVLVATPRMALEAAAETARAAGYAPIILGDGIEGEARRVAQAHAAIALGAARREALVAPDWVAPGCAAAVADAAPPCVFLSGGETTVTVTGRGRGGRNTEFLLALAIALGGEAGIYAIACDTDGIDGSGDNAGAVCAPDTLARAGRAGLDAAAHLADNDAYSLFEKLGELVMTGPTLTNVNDFRAVLIEGRPRDDADA